LGEPDELSGCFDQSHARAFSMDDSRHKFLRSCGQLRLYKSHPGRLAAAVLSHRRAVMFFKREL
jgi:hypothetical protein